MPETEALFADVQRELDRFVETARSTLGDHLVAVVLFGSAAEGRWRPLSDVNLLLVLERFDPVRVDGIRQAFRSAHASIHLEVMFLLRSELPEALETFGDKFSDILARHRVLHGPDVLAGMEVAGAAVRIRLRQVLLNLALRLRERYALVSLREEQLAALVADGAGPLRASAATLLRLEGQPAPAPKEALEQIVRETGLADGPAMLRLVSQSREQGTLPVGEGPHVLLFLIEVAQHMRARVQALPEPATAGVRS